MQPPSGPIQHVVQVVYMHAFCMCATSDPLTCKLVHPCNVLHSLLRCSPHFRKDVRVNQSSIKRYPKRFHPCSERASSSQICSVSTVGDHNYCTYFYRFSIRTSQHHSISQYFPLENGNGGSDCKFLLEGTIPMSRSNTYSHNVNQQEAQKRWLRIRMLT